MSVLKGLFVCFKGPTVYMTFKRVYTFYILKKGGVILSNEVVKYNNQMNSIALKNFNAVEMDLFYALCTQVKNKGTDDILLQFEQLKELSNYKPTANKRFINDLRRTNKKLLNLQFTFENDHVVEDFVLFTTFSINKDDETMIISVNKRFDFFLNELTSNFTRFELEEFTNLESKYSKAMYRLLKQWRTIGKKEWSIEDFRYLLDIPKSYQLIDIDRKVLKPIEIELSPIFKNFNIQKIKRGRGGKVVALEFTFQKEIVPKPSQKLSKKVVRKENLPDWAKDNYTPPKPKLMDKKTYEEFETKMATFGNKIDSYESMVKKYEKDLAKWGKNYQ